MNGIRRRVIFFRSSCSRIMGGESVLRLRRFQPQKESLNMKATVLIVLGCLVMASVGPVFAQEKVSRMPADQLKWVAEPDGLGFQQTVVEGDPSKPGLYIIQ